MQNHEVPILSIIIVNYNVRDEIINCIESIKDHINPYDTPYEVIVSDNGSSDGSIELISQARQVLSNYITAGIYFFIKKDYKESMINARKHTIKLKAFYRALISRSI